MPAKRKSTRTPAGSGKTGSGKIVVQNVNVPGYTHRVDAVMYDAMRRGMLRMLPRKAPGMTQAQMWQGLAAYVPKQLFPNRGKIGWWMKTVQLDLEARKVLVREPVKPLRWHRVK